MEVKIDLLSLVMAFSHMLDRVLPELAGHHQRVGYFSDKLAIALHMSERQRLDLVLSGLLHDVGALPARVSADDLIFERDPESHSDAGSQLLSNCPPLAHLARIVRFHHTPWSCIDKNDEAQHMAAIVNLADRMDVFVHTVSDPEQRARCISNHFAPICGKAFAPEHVAAMHKILYDPDVQAHLAEPSLPYKVDDLEPLWLSSGEVLHFCKFIGHVIDYRSPFTATHSAGVAQTARTLGQLAGIPECNLDVLSMAGMLHDIGKLDIPLAILEKPGPLTMDEAAIMRSHAQLGEHWLNAIPGFETICRWGTLHHERMNGGGYPHGYRGNDLCLAARVMAVADVFTAVTEDRPYRIGMGLHKSLEVLGNMARIHLDPELVKLTTKHGRLLDEGRRASQSEAHRLYALCQKPDAFIN